MKAKKLIVKKLTIRLLGAHELPIVHGGRNPPTQTAWVTAPWTKG